MLLSNPSEDVGVCGSGGDRCGDGGDGGLLQGGRREEEKRGEEERRGGEEGRRGILSEYQFPFSY